MRRKYSLARAMVSVCLGFLLGTMLFFVGSVKEASATVTLNLLTAPAGGGIYDEGLGISELLRLQKHPLIRINVQETQGSGYNFRAMREETWRHKDTLASIGGTALHRGSKNLPPYELPPGSKFQPRALYNDMTSPEFFITPDPTIKTIYDLKGKRVATGLKAGLVGQQTVALLEIAGLLPYIKMQHTTFTREVDTVNDGLADACFVFQMGNLAEQNFNDGPQVTMAKASGRPYHAIGIPEDLADKAIKAAWFSGKGVYAVDPLTGNPPPFTFLVEPSMTVVDDDFPEEIAYQLVKFLIENADKLKKYGGFLMFQTPRGLADCTKWPAPPLHPGAIRAYKEAGLIK